MFGGTPFGRPTVGALEDVGRPPFFATTEFYRTRYVPNNMAIVLVEDVDVETTLPIVEQAFGDWEPQALPERPAFSGSTLSGRAQIYFESLPTTPAFGWSVPHEGPLAEWERLEGPPPGPRLSRSVRTFARPRVLVVVDASEGNAEIHILLTREPLEPEDALDADLLEAYLDNHVSGRLHHELRTSRSLVFIIDAEAKVPSSPHDDAVMRVEMSAEHHNVIEIIATAWSAIRRPVESGYFDGTRAVVEAGYRGRRIHPVFVPFAVARWQRAGFEADPLLTQWPALPRMTKKQLDAFNKTFTARPPITTIRGDLDRIGLDGLERLGDVEIVTVDRVFGHD